LITEPPTRSSYLERIRIHDWEQLCRKTLSRAFVELSDFSHSFHKGIDKVSDKGDRGSNLSKCAARRFSGTRALRG